MMGAMVTRLFCLLVVGLWSVSAFAFAGYQWHDTAWQAQFTGAVHWSTLGVNDDSGASDNTAALNALPVNVPIIADCPHGGFVQFTGTWLWQSGLTVWQQQGCVLKSTITTPGVFPIENYPLGRTGSIHDVQYYGWQFSFVTPTSTVRAIIAYIDHFKFKYFDLNGSGGFAFLRGSDQEVAYGTMENTMPAAGNPGIRHFGNIPLVPTSPGMHANDWFHNLNFQTGDAAFQTCQPITNANGTWLYGVSSDGILYEDSYGNSASSAVILVNDIPGTHTCQNITYRNITGAGRWGTIIGGNTSLTNNVLIDGFAMASNGQGSPVIGVGKIVFGGITADFDNTSNVTLNNISVKGAFGLVAEISATVNTTINGITLGAPLVGLTSPFASLLITGAHGATVINPTIAVGNNVQGILDQSEGTTIQNPIITGVTDTKFGLALGNNSDAARVVGGSISPALGSTLSTGIALTANPNGTTNASVTGVNVAGMPTPVICASGQGNSVMSNIGASDCAP